MKSGNKQLNELFQQWMQISGDYKMQFISDGIANENEYNSAIPKVLFIAKEPNDPTKESWDYFKLMLDFNEFRYPFLYRLAEWAYGIFNDFPPIEELWQDEKKLHKVFNKIAFMNVKKSGGNGASDSEIIDAHIKNNLSFLLKEIEIVDPEIIITCLSWETSVNILFPETQWKSSGYNIRIGRNNKAKVIDFYHPSSRNAPAAVYSLLQNIINSKAFQSL